jgi:predicted SAM-dependent methyltransferase
LAEQANPPAPRGVHRLLNFGCGKAFHPDWVNLDSSDSIPGVIKHDLRRGLPFPDASFDAAYGSHVLEHLELEAAERLLRECLRVLKPDGIARIVVPDLEAIARQYLESLAAAIAREEHAEFRYDWSILEMYDQSVRTVTGGRMASCLRGKLGEDEERFVEGRIGREAMQQAAPALSPRSISSRSVLRRLRSAVLETRTRAAAACARLFLGAEGAAALREGLFRRGGEVHQHMYDHYSLQRAMTRAGFVRLRRCSEGESEIPEFARFGLEVRDGRARKPDSLYLEGRKPRAS